MIDVAALTSGRDVPSSRFRVRQYVRRLSDLGMTVREYVPAIDKYRGLPPSLQRVSRRSLLLPAYAALTLGKLAVKAPGVVGSWNADATWLSRELIKGHRTVEALLRKPVVLDIDDAIWLTYPRGGIGLHKTIRSSAAVMAGNSFIASYVEAHGGHAYLVPTTVDCDRFVPFAWHDRPFTVGWTGSSSNFPFLTSIEGALHRFMASVPEARVLVVADQRPRLERLDASRVDFVRWTEDVEVSAIGRMDVGLAPLGDDDWSRGKCGLKVLEYLACGRPVVGSRAGVNPELITDEVGLLAQEADDWAEALTWLYRHRDALEVMGRAGRRRVEESYSVKAVSPLIASVFRFVTGRSGNLADDLHLTHPPAPAPGGEKQ